MTLSVSQQINRVLVDLSELTTELTQDLAFGIHGDLVEETPVDLGWAASNWWFGVGSPPIGNNGTETDGGSVSAREGQQSASILPVATYDISSGKPIFITSGVPYLGRLNAGSSTQAPANFVETIVIRNVRRVQALADRTVNI